MINLFDKNTSKKNKKNFISLTDINLKEIIILKNRNINTKLSETISKYIFSINTNYLYKKEKKSIYIFNIELNEFILNITPNGLRKISKSQVLGIDEAKKRIKYIEEQNKQKEKVIQEPGKEFGIKAPGDIT